MIQHDHLIFDNDHSELRSFMIRWLNINKLEKPYNQVCNIVEACLHELMRHFEKTCINHIFIKQKRTTNFLANLTTRRNYGMMYVYDSSY